ncbi:MAG TPA: tRNA-uridine aminocarboxypropyltransferase [Magnetospirillaceae bacterium]
MSRRPHSHYRPRRGRGAKAAATGPSLSDFPGTPCPICEKPESLCVCASVTKLAHKVEILILQHPQEQDKVLGSARLAAAQLENATFRVGLSWSSLTKALGREADPKRWAVLYLGSVEPEKIAPGREVVALDARGALLPGQDDALADIEGVVLFDGTWSQAKTLWWRNPWVLKARRLILAPNKPSRYGALRREPRAVGLSTLESAAFLLARLEKRPDIETEMFASFERMLTKYRDASRLLRGRNTIAAAPPQS